MDRGRQQVVRRPDDARAHSLCCAIRASSRSADGRVSSRPLARGLTQGHSHSLGVVAFGLEYFGPSSVVTGIERQAAQMGYSISLTLIHEPETNDVRVLLSSLFARQVDGIVWAIPEIGDNRTWSHATSPGLPVPVMLVGPMSGPTTLPSIGIDNRAIGRLATEHLIAGGARHVGIITGPLDWLEAQQRQEGWRSALEGHGLDAGDRLVVEGDWNARSGEEGLHQLLAQAPEVDAAFACNDQMALGVLHAAHGLGRRVPEDLSVVGADNIAESSHFWPALTTVEQRLREAGALAVQQIDQLITSARQSRRTPQEPALHGSTLQPELIIRESSRRVA